MQTNKQSDSLPHSLHWNWKPVAQPTSSRSQLRSLLHFQGRPEQTLQIYASERNEMQKSSRSEGNSDTTKCRLVLLVVLFYPHCAECSSNGSQTVFTCSCQIRALCSFVCLKFTSFRLFAFLLAFSVECASSQSESDRTGAWLLILFTLFKPKAHLHNHSAHLHRNGRAVTFF